MSPFVSEFTAVTRSEERRRSQLPPLPNKYFGAKIQTIGNRTEPVNWLQKVNRDLLTQAGKYYQLSALIDWCLCLF